MAELDERIDHLRSVLATPADDRDDDALAHILRNLEQLRAEMTLDSLG
jgi:hypothetical protein